MRTIAHISDLHFGRHNLNVMEDLVTSIAGMDSDLVVISGDFTQRARHAEFAEARLFLDRISSPKLVTPGNHDVPLYNLFSRIFRPFRNYDRYIAPVDQRLSLYEDDELAVLALNSARRFTRKNGRLSHRQIADVARIFEALPSERFKVIVTHHPLAVPSGQDSLELAGRASDALRAIADTGIHLLLSGHHHRAISGPIADVGAGGSILIVHAGTAISTRTRRGAANSYNLIKINHRSISVSVMAWGQGTGFVAADAATYVLEAGRWKSSRA
jgi:3',5'-cyclic AMP phosphodiesterase CpdA